MIISHQSQFMLCVICRSSICSHLNTACEQLTISWSLHLQLSAGKPQTIQVDDSLLPPGGGRPVWGGSRLGRGSGGWPEATAPDTGPSGGRGGRGGIPAATTGFRWLEKGNWNVFRTNCKFVLDEMLHLFYFHHGSNSLTDVIPVSWVCLG